MGSRLKVEVLEPAPDITFRWLDSMLSVPIAACRFKSPPGVMFMPLCRPGKSASNGQYCRVDDGRVRLSTKLKFWHPFDIVGTYLHEATHAIVDAAEMKMGGSIKTHGAVFLLVRMVLHERVDASKNYRWVLKNVTNFYDFQDAELNSDWPEHRWRSWVINFAFKHYRALAEMDVHAEELGLHAYRLWRQECVLAEKWQSTAELDEARGQVIELEKRVQQLEDEKFIAPLRKYFLAFNWGFLVMGGGLFGVCVFTAGYGVGLARAAGLL